MARAAIGAQREIDAEGNVLWFQFGDNPVWSQNSVCSFESQDYAISRLADKELLRLSFSPSKSINGLRHHQSPEGMNECLWDRDLGDKYR